MKREMKKEIRCRRQDCVNIKTCTVIQDDYSIFNCNLYDIEKKNELEQTQKGVCVGNWVSAFKSFTGLTHVFRINKMDKKGVYYVHGKKELFFDWNHTTELTRDIVELLGLEW